MDSNWRQKVGVDGRLGIRCRRQHERQLPSESLAEVLELQIQCANSEVQARMVTDLQAGPRSAESCTRVAQMATSCNSMIQLKLCRRSSRSGFRKVPLDRLLDSVGIRPRWGRHTQQTDGYHQR